MICDQCGEETSVLNYAINHVDKMDLCADCFSRVPEEKRVDYKTPTHLEVRALATHDYDGVMRIAVGSVGNGPRRGEPVYIDKYGRAVVRDRDSEAAHHDFTESEESREHRENPAGFSASDVAELYNEGVGAPWVSDTGATVIPPTFQFTTDPVMAEVANLSFGAPANDLGAWGDSGTDVHPQILSMSGFPNQDDSIYGFTRDQLDTMQAERDELRASNEAQRQQLAAKDAIIEQLRERLDRAKRGS